MRESQRTPQLMKFKAGSMNARKKKANNGNINKTEKKKEKKINGFEAEVKYEK